MIQVVMIAALLWSGDFYSAPAPPDSTEAPVTFQSAVSIAADPDGALFVVDREAHRIVRCDGDGTRATATGGYGWSSTGFDEPLDISAPNGIDLYVADYGNHRIQRLDRNLNIISSLSFRDNDEPRERFGYPRSVAVDRFGSLYIVDGENERIVKVRNGNAFESAFGGIEAGRGRLQSPRRIRVSDDDIVYVQEDNAIVAFDLFGNYIRRVGEGLFASLQFIALDGPILYAVDSCSVVRITGKGTRIDRGRVKDIPSVPCDSLIDMVVRGDSLWLLTRSSILHSTMSRVFSFPEN